MQYIALISYASSTYSLHNRDAEMTQWATDFRQVLGSTASTSHQIITILSMLSSSLRNGQALPPYMELPKPFQLVRKLEHIDPDLLSVRHIAEVRRPSGFVGGCV